MDPRIDLTPGSRPLPRRPTSPIDDAAESGAEPLRPPLVKPRRRRGLWSTLGFLLSAPVAAFGTRQVVQGARTIEGLVDAIKARPRRDPRIRVEEDLTLDLRATAFLFGTSEAGIEKRLAHRRRQSARATYCYLAGGFGFLGLWFFEAVLSPTYASFSYVLGLLALCLAFFLSAFHQALINWQARTRRLGTVREFVNARETWWPS